MDSKAMRITIFVEACVFFFPASNFTIARSLTPAAFANSICDIPSNPRAARLWGPEIIFSITIHFLVDR